MDSIQTQKNTHVLFRNGNIIFDKTSNEYRYVKASSNIKKNTMLIIEHCICDKARVILKSIKFTPELYDSLYPRNYLWKDLNIEEENFRDSFEYDIHDKFDSNVFGNDEQQFILAKEISNFNHANDENAYVYHQLISLKNETAMFSFVFASRDIAKGEEITINYGTGDDLLFSKNNKKNISAITLKHMTNNPNIKTLFLRIIKQYLITDVARQVMGTQLLNKHGLYFPTDDVIFNNRDYEDETHIHSLTVRIYNYIKTEFDYATCADLK